MKKNIHPKYYPEAKIICACGNVITTGSTRAEMKVEVCSSCHPFYTGKKRLVDTAGQLDRFKKRFEKTEKMKVEKGRKKPKLAKIAPKPKLEKKAAKKPAVKAIKAAPKKKAKAPAKAAKTEK